MATVTGMTADAMHEIADASVVSGAVDDSGDLVLTTHGGDSFVAGHVKGEKGDAATAKLLPGDTATVDLSMTGAGTTPDPWILKADVKTPAVLLTKLTLTLMDSVTGGWYAKGADGVTYGPFPYRKNYFPAPGDIVTVAPDGANSFIIEGAQNEWKPLNQLAGTSYNANNADNQWNYLEYCVKNGFVNIRGLLAFTSAASSQLVAILPIDARPDIDMIIKVNNSDVIRSFLIKANGELVTGAVTINGYYSMDGLVFPVAGKASWTYVGDPGSGLAFANGWGNYLGGTGQFGKVGFWRDEYDFVWMRGMLSGGSVVANTTMITIANPDFMPWSGPTTNGQQHTGITSADLFGNLNILGGGGLDAIRFGSGSNPWVSVFGVHYLTNASYNHPDWIEHGAERGTSAGWLTYDATNYPTFAFRQRPDGMIVTKGLIKSGSVGAGAASRLDYMPDSFRSERSTLLSNVANQAYSRLDVYGRQQTTGVGLTGAMSPAAGSNVWFSLDNLHWFA